MIGKTRRLSQTVNLPGDPRAGLWGGPTSVHRMNGLVVREVRVGRVRHFPFVHGHY